MDQCWTYNTGLDIPTVDCLRLSMILIPENLIILMMMQRLAKQIYQHSDL